MTLRLAIMAGIYGVFAPTALGTTVMPDQGAVAAGNLAGAFRLSPESRALQEAGPPAAGPQVIRRAPDGMFYLKASVNGRAVRFLIDTGASHIILTAADAKLAGVRVGTLSGENVATVSGPVDTRWTRLDHVEIAGKDFRHLRAAVVESNLEVSLLGQNALAQLGQLTFDGDELRLN